MSKFFIYRPNFAWVIAIFISLAGILSIPKLPIAQFPVVAPPQISISASYPGASAKMVAETITSIIEEEINGVKNLLYYESSSSSDGSSEVTVTFKSGTDPDLAQVDIQNRLKKAEARLPQVVINQGVQVEQANADFLMMYALNYKEGASGDLVTLSDYAVRNINNEIRRLPGVGRVQFFSSEAAMRIWIDPIKLLGYGLSISDVTQAIKAQNLQVSAGALGRNPTDGVQEVETMLNVRGNLENTEEFEKIILKANLDGSTVLLSDVARLEIGNLGYGFSTSLNGKEAIAAAIQLAPGANAIKTAGLVKEKMAQLSAGFPEGIEYSIPYDTSRFVEIAIQKVVQTLVEAIVLVFFVILLFLQNLRYTLIPSIVVPVCLLGTLAVMNALGFSVNMMTMFGMVLAIGILVDDAIVVVENVERIMREEGISPKEATLKAMKQVSGAIVGITSVLTAVFLPLGFMEGSVGVIYRQFSLSLAVSILFSGFLALTLAPALCATILKPIKSKGEEEGKKGKFFAGFNKLFAAIGERYAGLNKKNLKRPSRIMLLYVGLIGVLVALYIPLPQSFVPDEDQGYFLVDIQLPAGATTPRTMNATDDVEAYALGRSSMQDVIIVRGFSFSGVGSNAAVAFPVLKDWSKRNGMESVENEVMAFGAKFADYEEANIMAINPPPIEGLGTSGGFSLRLQDRGGIGMEALLQATNDLLAKLSTSPQIAYAYMEGLGDAPRLSLEIDRIKAESLGLSFEVIGDALSSVFGSSILNDFPYQGRMQRVVVQADAPFRMTPWALEEIYLVSRTGEQVALSSVVHSTWDRAPIQIVRYNGYPSVRITGDASPFYSTGEVMALIEEIIKELPKGIGYEWTGLSLQERESGAQAPRLFALSILVVFLILVALYESWSLPFSVMLIVPVGAFGAVLAAWIGGMSNDVYFKVGLVTIIGLAAKNAILIVEFAKEIRAEGYSVVESALKAASLRFRPIVMTSMAFILGVLPLVLAQGAGAASQKSIGTGVMGGMLSATLLGVLLVPIFYVWVFSLAEPRAKNQEGEKGHE